MTPPNNQTSPLDTSSLNPFVHSRVFLLFDSLAPYQTIQSIQITVNPGASEKAICVPVKTLDKADLIHKLAARSMLHDLEGGRNDATLQAKGAVKGSWAYRTEIRKAAEAIACKWSLVSKWTSFVLVENGQSAREGAFQQGAVLLGTSCGGDLLRPRNLQLHPGVISMSRPMAQNKAIVPSPGDSGTVHHIVDQSPTPSIKRASMSNRAPQNYSVLPPFSLPTSSYMCTKPIQVKRPLEDATITHNIRALVSHQRFDGCFDFGGPERRGERYLGASLAAALLEISNERPDLTWPVIFTIAVLVLIWRDYGAYKSYWQALEFKALSDLNVQHSITTDTVSLVRERLENLVLPTLDLPVSAVEEEGVDQKTTCYKVRVPIFPHQNNEMSQKG